MWFKNARIYSVTLEGNLKALFADQQKLEEYVQAAAFKPASALEMSSCGFAPLFERNGQAFTFSSEHNHFFKFVEETKLLPSSVIKQSLADAIEIKEQELGRSLSKQEREGLKTALTNKLLTQAFATRKELLLWVNSEQGFVAVSASSAKKAENAILYLRKALGGSFPAVPFQPRCVVEERLSQYVTKNNLPQGFVLGSDAVLKSLDDDGGTVRVTKEDLSSEEVLNHLKAGKVVTDLQLSYNESLSFVINNELCLKRLVIADQYLEKNLSSSQDRISDMQGILLLQGHLLTRLIAKIIEVFDCDK